MIKTKYMYGRNRKKLCKSKLVSEKLICRKGFSTLFSQTPSKTLYLKTLSQNMKLKLFKISYKTLKMKS